MRAADSTTLATLRMALTAVTNAEVGGDVARDLTDDEVVAVLVRESRKRLDAAEAYSAAGRPDRAAEEQAEYDVLARYLRHAQRQRVGRDRRRGGGEGGCRRQHRDEGDGRGGESRSRIALAATVDGSLVAAKVRSALSS